MADACKQIIGDKETNNNKDSKKEVRKMLKKIYEELVLIRKELQTIRKKSESKERSRQFFGGNFIQTSKENKADDLMISTAQFGKKSLKWYIRMLCANVKTDPDKTLESWDD